MLHSIACLVVAILFSTISGPVCTSLHRAANFRPKAVKLRNPCVISNLQRNMLKQCITQIDELFVGKLWSVALLLTHRAGHLQQLAHAGGASV